ncbi:MAG: hypothetical protein IIX70_06320 [Oscillospiraceae bacterium]|nr:hypothetical protein [Oscillospiraceae bacterium]
MKKSFFTYFSMFFAILFLPGCKRIGEKTASISILYGAIAIFSLVLLICYYLLVNKKQLRFFFLFSSVAVVNTGYFLLSVSKTLNAALFANRLSYLGSVFLPMIMFIIIMKGCKITAPKWLFGLLAAISISVFFLAASPGYLTIYYESVSLETVNGISVLKKVYGPLHSVYLFYLLLYFCAMLGVIIYSFAKKKIKKTAHVNIFLSSVFINICVWLFEQLVKIDFELLSVSYIVTELFLLGVHLLLQEEETERKENEAALIKEMVLITEPAGAFSPSEEDPAAAQEYRLQYENYTSTLTPTEKKILELHLSGKSTKEIMETLCITENTVKFHNKNLYRKFGVTSKKQLISFCDKAK